MLNENMSLAMMCLLLAMFYCAPAGAAQQQTPGTNVKRQQRDQVIQELLERIRALELQAGVLPPRHHIGKVPVRQQAQDEPVTNNRPPGLVTVDDAMAERALERSLSRSGAVLLAAGTLELEPQLSYVRQEDSIPSFVNTSSGVIASQTQNNSDSLFANIIFRYGLPGDAQLEVAVPYHWRRVQTVTRVNFSPIASGTQSGSGRGDVQFTLAKTLAGGDSQIPNVIGNLSWNSGNGTRSDNAVSLGAGYQSLQAGLTFSHRQDPLVLVSGLSYRHSFEKEGIQPGATTSVRVGGYLALNPQTSMNLGVTLAYQQETRLNGAPQVGSARTIGTLMLGGSSLVGRGTLLNLSLGIGLTRAASDFSLMLSLPMRF